MKMLIAAILICMPVYTAPLYATEAKHAPIHTLANSITEVSGSGMDYQNTTFSQVRDTTNKQELFEQARQRGSVRVMITYSMGEYSVESDLDVAQRVHQRHSIADMHERFVQEITKENLNVTIGRKMQTSPRMSLSVDDEGLRYLYNSPLIEKIEVVRSGTVQ